MNVHFCFKALTNITGNRENKKGRNMRFDPGLNLKN